MKIVLFIRRLFQKELSGILAVFDKAHRELDSYIERTDASARDAQRAADFHMRNLDTAQIVKGNLTALTSTTRAVTV